MKNRKWLVLALVIIAMMSLAKYTGVSEGALLEPETELTANTDLKPVDEAPLAEIQPPLEASVKAPEQPSTEKPETGLTIVVEPEPSAPAPSIIVEPELPAPVPSIIVEPELPAPVPSIIVDNAAIQRDILAQTKQDVAPAFSTIQTKLTIATPTEAKTPAQMAAVSLERQVEQAADIMVKPDVRVLREDVKAIANARVTIVGKTGRVFESAVLNFHGIRLNAANHMVEREGITIYDALYKLGAPVAEYWLSTWAPPLKNPVSPE
ncbi:hypothetical protein ACFLWR_06745 [Chloroflexota bacterium]